ncbi:DinB family protein [Pedobacter polaris]|uniref:DinB family protein n=1 Tax=Pedobacter polaris TaxID=2571273 RepID=A0A4U1CEA9_9SPHI|nr:DinB family protein [Pedobacter polaris]TKC04792.1 DinB family protein [Pedobacter polaris]
MIDLVDELKKAYTGDAWHGNNTLSLLLTANPAKVFTHPIPNAHSIAELVLHLTAWTEEVVDRISGQGAKEPAKGDWPETKEMSESQWQSILEEFKTANDKLIELVNIFQPSQWSNDVKDERDRELGAGVNNAQLINGLIQHHAYHSGQIALLLKF